MRLSIVGLGKLGAPMAAVMANKGHSVIGVDLNPRAVEAINDGRAPVREPGLDDMIAANREWLSATGNIGEAVDASDITFIIVPTPSEEDGRFSMRYVMSAIEGIGSSIEVIPTR